MTVLEMINKLPNLSLFMAIFEFYATSFFNYFTFFSDKTIEFVGNQSNIQAFATFAALLIIHTIKRQSSTMEPIIH